MKVKLNKLIIKGFKGIDDFTLEIGGENATLIGENGTGKTSVADAFYWLLTDSNLERKSKFGIIKNSHEKAEVEGELFFGSKLKVLKKIYCPVIKKNMITGYTTIHYVDGIEMTQKEYQKEINLNIDIRLISDVHYFMSIPVTLRRTLLFSLISKISDDDIIKEYKDLRPAKQILNNRDFATIRLMLTREVKNLSKERDEIPVEIRTARSMLPGKKVRKEATIRKHIDKLDEQIADVKHGGNIIKHVALLKAELISLETNIRVQYESKEEKLRTRRFEIKTALNSNYRTITDEKEAIESKQKSLFQFNDQIDNLHNRWKEEKAMKYNPSTVCYACKQKLPLDQITRQEDEFKKEIAQSLKQIDMEGKELRKVIKNIESKISLHASIIEKIQSDIEKLEDELNIIEKKIEEIDRRMQEEIKNKRKKIEEQIKALKNENENSDLYKLKDEKSKLEAELNLSILEEDINIKISRYEKKQSKISKEIEAIEKNIWLLDEFNRKKAEYIESVIDDKFVITEWKLFRIHQNGNIEDICDPQFDEVPYIDLNTGSKINIGLDIVNTFASHYDIEFPVFVDNSESITNWIPSECQLINLKAMEGWKTLKIT